ncbi:MarR family winged helix-turn-helix transcriptional regulator [Sphingomonas mucosissima]|uniref:Transcriptional repressor MprA n=1 Tax=Sphingomonas mucosissima TaxID=370959 RepID=A0A245ZJR2_9SPHN|nr:MarR family winged helix-turn-helix transcriptional regulator [Sphingomonas mucosissima]OWK29974.1 transcriptional repressor MprA [Sphingomonas mucosissima]
MRVTATELLEAIGHLNVRLAAKVARQVPAGGLTTARYRTLRFIQARAPATAGQVRSFFGLSPRTVTEAVDSLERDGLIRRERDERDRRVTNLIVLPAGAKALEAAQPLLNDTAEAAFAELDEGEREQLLKLLNRVLENVG